MYRVQHIMSSLNERSLYLNFEEAEINSEKRIEKHKNLPVKIFLDIYANFLNISSDRYPTVWEILENISGNVEDLLNFSTDLYEISYDDLHQILSMLPKITTISFTNLLGE